MSTKLVGLFLVSAAAWGAHNRLLPQPQKISYGQGRLVLAGVPILFGAAPSEQDWFAARELAAGLAAALGHTVSIGEGTAQGAAIILERTGEGPALPQKAEDAGPNSREAYQLQVTPQRALIRARSSTGLYYGVQTLLQMVEGGGAQAALPEAEISDWPSLAYRGVMMDLSHGPMPTEQEIRRQIDFLARWKGNQYYFYSELTIELKGYPLLNPGARYSQEEVRRIIDYARQRHVDVVPCLEFYGHLHDMFRLERYSEMAALPHGGEINPRHPKMLPMMQDWLDQMAQLFESPWFHIGLDEPWELERAGSAAAGGVEPSKLYLGHLQELAKILGRHSKRVMFWADVSSGAALFDRYPQLASELPKDTVAVVWDYNPRKSFERMLAPFTKAGVAQVIAPGTWGWQDIAPDFPRTFANIDGFVADGRKHKTLGVINTNWSDDAQLFFRATLPGIAYGAAAAWQTQPMDRPRFFADYSERMYTPAVAAEVAAALDALAKAQQALIDALGRETMFRLWDDPLLPSRLDRVQAHVEDLRKARLAAEDAQEHLERALALQPDTYSIPSLLVDVKLIDYAGMKFLYSGELAGIFRKLGSNPSSADVSFWLSRVASRNHGRIDDLLDTITELREQYRAAWNAEYTPYRLGTALGRFDGEYEYWRRMQSAIWDFTRGFRDKDPLPPLETFRPWGWRPAK